MQLEVSDQKAEQTLILFFTSEVFVLGLLRNVWIQGEFLILLGVILTLLCVQPTVLLTVIVAGCTRGLRMNCSHLSQAPQCYFRLTDFHLPNGSCHHHHHALRVQLKSETTYSGMGFVHISC